MKIEITNEDKEKGVKSKIIKHLSIDKTKIPLTEEEYEFMRKAFDEHIAKHGIAYGFVYNLFLKEDRSEQQETTENRDN